MNKATKIWLWIALALCACSTVMNMTQARWLSVAIAVVSLAGLCALLFAKKRTGFLLMCVCAVASFLVGSIQSVQGGLSVALAVGMSLVGSALVPLITGLFLKSQWAGLK